MTLEDLGRILSDASRFYLNGEMSGPAYSRLVEALIVTSGFEEANPSLEEVADSMASYTPGGVDGLFDDSGLRALAQRLVND